MATAKPPRDQKQRNYKVVVIGSFNTGKTCLIHRFCSGTFMSDSTPTIGVDVRQKKIAIENNELNFFIWDTAGQERFRHGLTGNFYRNVAGIVFVYDVTRMDTFTELHSWIEECRSNGVDFTKVPMVVVGNKCDELRHGLPAVPRSIAQEFADHFKLPLFITSAKNDFMKSDVEAIFTKLAKEIVINHAMKKYFDSPGEGTIDLRRNGKGKKTLGRRLKNGKSKAKDNCNCS